MKCPICDSEKSKKSFQIDNHLIVKCSECGLVRLEHQLSFNDIKSLYEKNYFESPIADVGYANYKAVEKSLRLNFKKRAQKIIKSLKDRPEKEPLTLLDVGAAAGFFVSEAIKLGITAEGLEVSKEAVEFARNSLKLNLYQTTLEEFDQEKKYDVVTAWDVIEHITDPNEFLERINVLLKKGGSFFFTTGDISSLCARISGRRWHLFNLPGHLFFYSKNTIFKILEKNGFQIKSVTYPSNYYELGYLAERFLKKVVDLKDVTLINKLSYNPVSKSIILPFNLYDVMEVEAVKKNDDI